MKNLLYNLVDTYLQNSFEEDISNIVNNAFEKDHLEIYNIKIKNPKPSPNRAVNIFDVGSYLGNFSKSIKKNLNVKKNVYFYLFDPNPNLNLHDFDYFCLGLSDRTTSQKFYLNSFFPSSGSGYNTITKDDFFWNLSRKIITLSPQKSFQEFNTYTTTLDEFCKNKKIKSIEILKIDTEGHELNVLNGGKKILKRTKIIQLEILDKKIKFKKKAKKIDTFLQNNNFYLLNNKKIYSVSIFSNLEARDYLYVNRSLLTTN